MTAKLNQVIAIEKGIKSRVYAGMTDLNKAVQKTELFNGFQKTYRKKDDDGEELPAESKRVQFSSKTVLEAIERGLTELMTVTGRKDYTNCVAYADVKVDGKVLVEQAPVSYLLFLEKQLNDIRTLIGHMPVLDIGEDWLKDENSGLYKTVATSTHRTKKVQKPLVLYPATDKHPAQTQIVTEDVIAGYWDMIKHSGAMPKPEKDALLERIEKLARAIKEAREAANMQNVVAVANVGTNIFAYLYGDQA